MSRYISESKVNKFFYVKSKVEVTLYIEDIVK
jgi:hypothetical protein